MHRFRSALIVFVLFVVWDWLATVDVRYIAETSLLAVPVTVATTALWVWGVRISVDKATSIALILVAAALGTWLGILWP